ncbi:MAG: YjjG family noncanonical pyrimidine nucleotidase [Eubacteriales bacterium]
MSKFDTILFDVDGTLLDFDKTEKEALENTFRDLGIEPTESNFSAYIEANTLLWAMLERGEIEKGKLKTERFRIFLNKINKNVDVNLASDTYINHLSNSYFIIDGAIEICRKLKKKFSLAIVTNGIAEVQKSRAALSGLSEIFNYSFISEDVGHAKPHIEYFNYVFEKLKIKNPEKVLIVGDSLTSDIKGGNNAGIKTCWYNPEQKANDTDSICDYEIKSLYEIEDILY